MSWGLQCSLRTVGSCGCAGGGWSDPGGCRMDICWFRQGRPLKQIHLCIRILFSTFTHTNINCPVETENSLWQINARLLSFLQLNNSVRGARTRARNWIAMLCHVMVIPSKASQSIQPIKIIIIISVDHSWDFLCLTMMMMTKESSRELSQSEQYVPNFTVCVLYFVLLCHVVKDDFSRSYGEEGNEWMANLSRIGDKKESAEGKRAWEGMSKIRRDDESTWLLLFTHCCSYFVYHSVLPKY